jgi:hypothetical protein
MSLRNHGGVWGRGCITPLILKLETKWKCLVMFTAQPLHHLEENYRVPELPCT